MITPIKQRHLAPLLEAVELSIDFNFADILPDSFPNKEWLVKNREFVMGEFIETCRAIKGHQYLDRYIDFCLNVELYDKDERSMLIRELLPKVGEELIENTERFQAGA